jgi:WS/DGAT/MGAT family acyltransferase
MDAAFLYIETPAMHMHAVGVLVLDPAGRPGGFGIDEVTRALAERIHLIPPLRRRALPPPAGIDHPLWIEDPEFDLSAHIKDAPLEGPVPWDRLEQFVGDVSGRPLDRTRPLWEMWVVNPLEDGTVALVTKIHHSLMDGGAGASLLASLFDLSPDADPVEPPDEPWVPDVVPSTQRQVTSSVSSLVARQKDVPGAVARTFSGLAGTTRTWLSQRAAGGRTPLTAHPAQRRHHLAPLGKPHPGRPRHRPPHRTCLRGHHQRRRPGGIGHRVEALHRGPRPASGAQPDRGGTGQRSPRT